MCAYLRILMRERIDKKQNVTRELPSYTPVTNKQQNQKKGGTSSSSRKTRTSTRSIRSSVFPSVRLSHPASVKRIVRTPSHHPIPPGPPSGSNQVGDRAQHLLLERAYVLQASKRTIVGQGKEGAGCEELMIVHAVHWQR